MPVLLHLLTTGIGTSRHFAATQQFSCFRSKADIQRAGLQNRIYEYASGWLTADMTYGQIISDTRSLPKLMYALASPMRLIANGESLLPRNEASAGSEPQLHALWSIE